MAKPNAPANASIRPLVSWPVARHHLSGNRVLEVPEPEAISDGAGPWNPSSQQVLKALWKRVAHGRAHFAARHSRGPKTRGGASWRWAAMGGDGQRCVDRGLAAPADAGSARAPRQTAHCAAAISLERVCCALREVGVDYAVVGGQAMALHGAGARRARRRCRAGLAKRSWTRRPRSAVWGCATRGGNADAARHPTEISTHRDLNTAIDLEQAASSIVFGRGRHASRQNFAPVAAAVETSTQPTTA